MGALPLALSNDRVSAMCFDSIRFFLYILPFSPSPMIQMNQFDPEIAATDGFQLGLESRGITVLGA